MLELASSGLLKSHPWKAYRQDFCPLKEPRLRNCTEVVTDVVARGKCLVPRLTLHNLQCSRKNWLIICEGQINSNQPFVCSEPKFSLGSTKD